ncbi:MAG: class I SAM-dependent methyltransferase [Candidatus Omnitrophica bacterium]|nr:class I SAM-dependent methyltransferase [Candidatus Omnitrophota bacterium]
MKNLFDRFYKRYDAWYDRHKNAFRSELKAVRRFLPRKGKGLEVGVGTGRFAASLGIQIGIDPSKKMIAIARTRGIDARWGRGESLPFPRSSFDHVVLIITLCFVQKPACVLKEARRVLKKNGTLLVGMIPGDSALGAAYQKKGSVFYKNARFFTVTELLRKLTALKFSDFKICETLFRSPDKMTRPQNPKDGSGKGGFVVVACRKNESGRRAGRE